LCLSPGKRTPTRWCRSN
jgi:3-isopropylmalate/(R)-2-methylmalate dehydratase small subunit